MTTLHGLPLPPGAVILAPMAGATGTTFRALCREAGADMTVTEMVSSRALCFKDRKTAELCKIAPSERPTALQLFGSDPAVMGEAAALAMAFSPDMIDINMGCPVPKIVGSGDGSALMRSPGKIEAITAAVKGRVPVPVSVKLRAGIDGAVTAVTCAKAAEAGGADMVTVHGRLREQYYRPSADWGIIAEVKRAMKIPVIANGDIADGPSAVRALAETGADGVMVGRAALGNPFVFTEIKAALAGLPAPVFPAAARLDAARRHLTGLCLEKGEARGVKEARSHLCWYTRGMRGASAMRAAICRVASLDEIEAILARLLEENA